MIKRGLIIFEDAHRHRFTVVLQGATSLAAVQDCVDILRTQSDAAVVSYAYTEEMMLTNDSIGSGAYDCTRQQLQLSYATDDAPIIFYLPAPKEVVVDAHQEAQAAVAKIIKEMLEASTNATGLIYRGGALVARRMAW